MHGEIIKIQPIIGLDKEIMVQVVRCTADRPLPANMAARVKRISIKDGIDTVSLKSAIGEIERLPDEFEEIWHKDYGEIDSGNYVDTVGAISTLLDSLADGIGWSRELPRFDKVHVRKNDDFGLNKFHADHFYSEPARTRLLGRMDRAIINLGESSRWLAVLVLPEELIKKYIADPYCQASYALLMSEIEYGMLGLIETPKRTVDNRLHGVVFNAFDLIHCGYGGKYDVAAIVSHWSEYSL
jgi:hypothetical protein